MMRVEGTVRRPRLGYESFLDLTEVPVSVDGIGRDGITFDSDLTEAEYAAVWARMESIDDADQERRAGLRAGRDAVSAAEPETFEDAMVLIGLLKTAVVDSLNYWLGEG